MSEYIRTQIMLEKEQRLRLSALAEDLGISFSELVRDFLNAQLRTRTYEEMKQAAERLYNDYAHDEDLTAMTSLDGEEFLND